VAAADVGGVQSRDAGKFADGGAEAAARDDENLSRGGRPCGLSRAAEYFSRNPADCFDRGDQSLGIDLAVSVSDAPVRRSIRPSRFADAVDHGIDELLAAEDASVVPGIEFFALPLCDTGGYELGELSAGYLFFRSEKPQDRIDIDDPRRPKAQVFALAAVWVVLRFRDHSGAHRIEMDVADQFAHVHLALAKDRFMPPLKKVPDLAVFPVIILAVPGQQPVHYPPDGVRFPLDQQVHVIGHQAVGVEEERELLFLCGQKREEPGVVFRRAENVLPVVPARDNVIKSTLDLDPCFACHVWSKFYRRTGVSQSSRDPILACEIAVKVGHSMRTATRLLNSTVHARFFFTPFCYQSSSISERNGKWSEAVPAFG
jgi:hypothetical protein